MLRTFRRLAGAGQRCYHRALSGDMRLAVRSRSNAGQSPAGALLLWVRTADAEREIKARETLSRHGAQDVHQQQHPAGR